MLYCDSYHYQCAFLNLPKLVIFLYGHFSIEDGRNREHFLHTMLLLFQESVKGQLKCKKICPVYGEATVTDQTCKKWFAKLRAESFLTDDALWLGRPAEIDSDLIGDVWSEKNSVRTIYGDS